MMRRSAFLCITALLGAFVLLGCGGGSDNDDNRNNTAVYPLTTRMKTLQNGDTWTYRLNGKFRNSQENTDVSGTLTRTVSTASFNTQSVLAITSAMTLTANGGGTLTFNQVSYYTQDAATGNLTRVGDDEDGVITNPIVELPGTWAQGFGYTQSYTFSNGAALPQSFSVTGSENVSTSLGTFGAWKATSAYAYDDLQVSETAWYAPQTGNLVKAVWVITDRDGATTTLDVDLQSTNAPL